MQMNTGATSVWRVIKFGGTSVSSKECWQNIAGIVKKHLSQGKRPLVVCSAPSGVSNLLEQLLQQAVLGDTANTLQAISQKYFNLNKQLQINCQDYLAENFNQLQQLIEGIHLIGEVTPRIHARVMAYGEFLLTHLGAEFLRQQGLVTKWQDVREWLKVEANPNFRHPDAYLSTYCVSDEDAELKKQLKNISEDVVITQGFVASNDRGETVLLGRGGSDSSAAYLAAKIGADRCEIWTDVPGIYTANPKQIPEARLITRLDYDEAQELASMGAKVLHPRCISPVSRHHIPLHVRYTPEPNRQGTEICQDLGDAASQIKSILTKHDIILISIETMQMWHQVGFLAEVAECFKRHGISIDLISTSESSVTVSLDKNSNTKEEQVLDALLQDLNQFAKATIIAPCASVSLVGRNIRSILPQLGSVFSVFEEQKVYLVSQAANDLNLTFVVDEDQAHRLARQLHHLLIEQAEGVSNFHLSWVEEFGDSPTNNPVLPWWHQSRAQLLALTNQCSPRYVYSKDCLQNKIDGLKACSAVDKIYYSIKANNNLEILRQIYQAGIGFECVSIDELNYIFLNFSGIDRQRILFTPNFASRREYELALQHEVTITVDNLYILKEWAELFSGKSIFIRVDPGEGRGHHKYVVTGGDQSKFGIPLTALKEASDITKKNRIKVIGLHNHSGSGILNSEHWSHVFQSLVKSLALFPDVSIINVGGGLGVVERPSQRPLDLAELNSSLSKVKAHYSHLQLWMEPGRYLVAESGILLAKVTQIKQKGNLQFVGIDTGMNSLIRPMLYGAYHEIVNLTRLDEPKVQRVNIVGPICESGDTLGYSRLLPICYEGDVILIANVGAYGRSMSSYYNLRPPAEEYFYHDK